MITWTLSDVVNPFKWPQNYLIKYPAWVVQLVLTAPTTLRAIKDKVCKTFESAWARFLAFSFLVWCAAPGTNFWLLTKVAAYFGYEKEAEQVWNWGVFVVTLPFKIISSAVTAGYNLLV